MSKLISVLLTSLAFVSVLASADQPHEHRYFLRGCPGCAAEPVASIEVHPEQTELTDKQIRDLANQGHHAMEVEDETHGKIRQFIEKFNFHKVALAKRRWNGMNRDQPHIRNAAANVSVLFLFTHGTEVVGGTTAILNGLFNPNLGPVESWALISGGFTVMIPGPDPLCWIGMGCYLAFPKTMNWLLTFPRIGLQKAAAFANAKLGLPPGYWSGKLHRYQEARLRDRLADSHVDVSGGDFGYLMVFHAPDGRDVATLDIEALPEGRMGVRRVELANATSEEYEQILKHAVSALGWNIGNWVQELVVANRDGKLDQIEKLVYVERVERSEDGLLVTTKPGAFAVRDVCADMLSGT